MITKDTPYIDVFCEFFPTLSQDEALYWSKASLFFNEHGIIPPSETPIQEFICSIETTEPWGFPIDHKLYWISNRLDDSDIELLYYCIMALCKFFYYLQKNLDGFSLDTILSAHSTYDASEEFSIFLSWLVRMIDITDAKGLKISSDKQVLVFLGSIMEFWKTQALRIVT